MPLGGPAARLHADIASSNICAPAKRVLQGGIEEQLGQGSRLCIVCRWYLVPMVYFEVLPNRSLTARSATVFYLSIVVPPLAIASLFAMAGFWPILTVAGVEVAILGAALWWTMRKTKTRELIEIDERNVLIRKCYPDRDEKHEFSRHWTQVSLVRSESRHWPSRLVLRSKGRSVEIGSFLTDRERDGLKQRLAEVIASGK